MWPGSVMAPMSEFSIALCLSRQRYSPRKVVRYYPGRHFRAKGLFESNCVEVQFSERYFFEEQVIRPQINRTKNYALLNCPADIGGTNGTTMKELFLITN